MKNTLKFGLLGVLAVAPYAFGLLTDSWSGRLFAKSILMRKSDAEIYGLIDRLLPFLTGRVFIFIYAFCWGLALGIGIWILYRAWRTHPLAGKGRALKWFEVLGRVAAIALFAVITARYGLDGFFIYPPEGVSLLLSSFGGALGPFVILAFPVAQVSAFMFALGAAIYAAFSARNFAVFAGRALAGVLVMAATLASLGAAAGYLDLDRYLYDIPGVTEDPEPRTLVVLQEKPVTLRLDESFNDCSVSDSFCRKIPCSSSNEEAVREYLEERGYSTALRGAGFNLIALNRLRELDPAGALSAFSNALVVTGDITQGISAVNRLVYSPARKPYHDVLDELGDDDRFVSTGRSALRLSKAYARFGELDRARLWFDRGLESLGGLQQADMKYFSVPESPQFNSGKIEGRLTVDGRPAQGIRVGLVREKVVVQIMYAARKKGGLVSPFFDLQGITDGTTTGEDGGFSFEGLAEENYLLMLSIKDADGAFYTAENGPGLIRTSEAIPSADVGTVNLSLKGR